jgi:hypothetical protein
MGGMKMGTRECPKCGEDISETYQGAEPDVGIMSGGWFCDACDLTVGEDEPETFDDDVQIFGTGGKVHLVPADRCPKCLSTNLEMGFGLAGGGFGPYSYCPNCGIVVHKSQDQT